MKRHIFKIMISALLLIPLQAYTQKNLPRQQDLQFSKATGEPSATLLNINNISMWIKSDGESGRTISGYPGTIFPRQTSPIIYLDGLIWGGRVKDGVTPEIRVGGQAYNIGTAAGAIVAPGIAEDPSLPVVRIWRVRKDYATADLSLDADESRLDVATLRSQYEIDWRDWPWQKGAPWIGLNNEQDGGYWGPDGVTILGTGNGILDRGEDLNCNGILDVGEDANANGRLDGEFPGIAGADQVVWTVANDLDPALTAGLYGSPPIGLEMQLTLWGYHVDTPLKNVIFKRYRLIYKGIATTPANGVIDSMYICQWSDPDIGEAYDDLAGCDTTLSLGYAYNGGGIDEEFSKFGLAPPAAGYDFLLGPIVPSADDTAIVNFRNRPGFRNLSMTTFAFFAAGQLNCDPDQGNYYGTLQWWNLLRGFRPRPESPPEPWKDPAGNITRFRVPGDPMTGTGWIDSGPADRRILLASGPFTMTLGDTQEVVIGLIGGSDKDHLSSIIALKDNDRQAQALFKSRFALMIASLDVKATYISNTQTQVFISAKVEGSATAVEAKLTDISGLSISSFMLFDDGAHHDGNPSDGLFANEAMVVPQHAPLDVTMMVRTAGESYTYEKVARVSTAGPIEISELKVVSDHINNDHVINPGENVRIVASLHNGSGYYFDKVTAAFNFVGPLTLPDQLFFQTFSNLSAGTTVPGFYDPADPSTFSIFEVRQDAQDGDTIEVNVSLFDALGNQWQQKLTVAVIAFEFTPGDLTPIEHISGNGDGDFFYRIINSSLLKDHHYEIHIIEPADKNDVYSFDLIDLDESRAVLSDQSMPDELSHHIPVTDGFKLFGSNLAVKAPITFLSATQTIDADTTDAGLTIFITRLYNELGNGVPAPSADILQRDIELRFTGITDSGDWFGRVIANGSWATQWEYRATGARILSGYTHVAVQIPFEVWDIENNHQINCAVINRNYDGAAPYGDGVGDPSTPGMEPRWRITGRDYIIPIFTDYNPNATQSLNDRMGTWLLYFHDWYGPRCTWTTGDVFKIIYANLLTNTDSYRFKPSMTGLDNPDAIVKKFDLSQNYPNPFNISTVIHYQVPRRSHISLKIYNSLGQLVRTLLDDEQGPGKYTIVWDGTNDKRSPATTGLYFYQFKSNDFMKIKKMILLK